MAGTSEGSVLERQVCCFQEWMDLQKEELAELQQAQTQNNHDSLSQLTGKCIQNFKDYMSQRRSLARDHVSTYFSPTWCSSLENSLLWIGGCRPTIFIRLVYALCGFESMSELTEFLDRGLRGSGTDENLSNGFNSETEPTEYQNPSNGFSSETEPTEYLDEGSRGSGSGTDQNPSRFGWLTINQLEMVDDLQRRAIKEEERMTSVLASLQEEICDKPLAMIARRARLGVGEVSSDSERELNDHAKLMVNALDEADELRLKTLEEILVILTPEQAVDYLAAGKKLRLCMHEWGMRRDQSRGRNQN